jgi:hypothetical protein
MRHRSLSWHRHGARQLCQQPETRCRIPAQLSPLRPSSMTSTGRARQFNPGPRLLLSSETAIHEPTMPLRNLTGFRGRGTTTPPQERRPVPEFVAIQILINNLSQGSNSLLAGLRGRRYFFSPMEMHTPDQRLWPRPGGGIELRGITPTFFATKGKRATR